MSKSHAIARTLISSACVGVAGVLTGGAAAIPMAASAIAEFISEFLNKSEVDKSQRDGIQRAINRLAKDLEHQQLDHANTGWALNVCRDVIVHTPVDKLNQLLLITTNKSHITALFSDRSLNFDDRALAERLMLATLEAWHVEIDKTDVIAGAFRQLLSAHQQRLEKLEKAGLSVPDIIRYSKIEHPPSQLFRPESCVLPFIGRDAELESLQSWAALDINFALRAYSGQGGIGKSRLAAHFLRQCQAAGWLAAFVHSADKLNLSPEHLPERIILALDYADYRKGELDKVLASIKVLTNTGKHVRLLLLSRPDAAWWDDVTRSVRQQFYQQYKQCSPRLITLPPLTEQSTNADNILREVARHSQLDIPLSPYKLPETGRPLIWMMAAYLHLHDQKPCENATEICEDIVLGHEREWLKQKLGSDVYLDGAMQVLALFTFAGGVKEAPACEALIRAVPVLKDVDSAQITHIFKSLKSTYPNDGGVHALQPDLLGEYLCSTELNKEPSGELMKVFIDWVIDMIQKHTNDKKDEIEWLLPLAQADNTCERAKQWPAESQVHNLNERWSAVLSALPPNIMHFLTTRDTLGHLKLRDFSVRLNELFLSVAGSESLKERAQLLNNYSVGLSYIGQREKALEAAQEALEIRRKLAEEHPDAFLPDVALSLNNSAKYLSELGQREQALEAAQEAVGLYRKLAEKGPDAFLPDLAMSLNNIANRLSDLGRREQALDAAEEAVGLYRKLAEESPDSFLPDVAMSLNNIANHLSYLGQREQALDAAQEAVGLYRKLAEERPDAFLPGVAMSLNNIANRLSDLGRREQALEAAQKAVGLCEKLAEERPDAFLPELAISLNNIAGFLSELGQREVALAAAHEALKIRRKLVEERPDVFVPDLAISLHVLCNCYSNNEQFDEACDAELESLELFAKLTRKYPDVYKSYAMHTLSNVETLLQRAGKALNEATLLNHPEALAFYRQQLIGNNEASNNRH